MIYWLNRYSFLPSFIMSKNSKGLWFCILIQGVLKLVYSEGKLQSCLKLRNFQNLLDKDKSVGLICHAQKSPTICTCCRVNEASPGFDEIPLKIFTYITVVK